MLVLIFISLKQLAQEAMITRVNLAHHGMRKRIYLSFISLVSLKNVHFSTYTNSYNREKYWGARHPCSDVHACFVVVFPKEYAFFVF